MADLKEERELWNKNYHYIAGCDEVGRGSFAGPIVAACVILESTIALSSGSLPSASSQKDASRRLVINDSKKLTEKQRKVSSKWIKKNARSWGIGSASVIFINKYGIVKATNQAFRRAIGNCNLRLQSTDYRLQIDYLLVDGFYVPYVRGLRRKNQKAIIGGDSKSISIAAASIIAKVYRDSLMAKLSKNSKYKKCAWDKNKGYGTKIHREAIQKHGPSRLHRKLWVSKLV